MYDYIGLVEVSDTFHEPFIGRTLRGWLVLLFPCVLRLSHVEEEGVPFFPTSIYCVGRSLTNPPPTVET